MVERRVKVFKYVHEGSGREHEWLALSETGEIGYSRRIRPGVGVERFAGRWSNVPEHIISLRKFQLRGSQSRRLHDLEFVQCPMEARCIKYLSSFLIFSFIDLLIEFWFRFWTGSSRRSLCQRRRWSKEIHFLHSWGQTLQLSDLWNPTLGLWCYHECCAQAGQAAWSNARMPMLLGEQDADQGCWCTGCCSEPNCQACRRATATKGAGSKCQACRRATKGAGSKCQACRRATKGAGSNCQACRRATKEPQKEPDTESHQKGWRRAWRRMRATVAGFCAMTPLLQCTLTCEPAFLMTFWPWASQDCLLFSSCNRLWVVHWWTDLDASFKFSLLLNRVSSLGAPPVAPLLVIIHGAKRVKKCMPAKSFKIANVLIQA